MNADLVSDLPKRELNAVDTFVNEGTPVMFLQAEDEDEVAEQLEEMGFSGKVEFVELED